MDRFRKVPVKPLFQRQWRTVETLSSNATALTPSGTQQAKYANHLGRHLSSWVSPWPREDRFVDPWRSSSTSATSKNNKTGEKRMKRHEIKNALSQIWLHSQKSNKSRPSKALRLLEQLLVEEAVTGNKILKQGIVFNVLKVCQQQQVPLSGEENNHTQDTMMTARLERVLDLLEDNDRLWDGQKWPSLVLGALAKRDPVRAETLLHDMHELSLSGGAWPNLHDYGAVLQSFAKQGMARQAEQLLETMEERHVAGELKEGPNTISYTCVVDALDKSHLVKDERNAADRAAKVVKQMEELFAVGNTRVQPNVITYSSLIKCYANEGKAEEAEEVLQRMHDLHRSGRLKDGPNIIAYSNAMKAWSNSNAKDAPDRSHALLKRIHELHAAGHPYMQPGSITYGILLKCFARHGKAGESIQVLKEMHEYHSAGVIREGPNTVLYNSVIRAVSQSEQDDAPERAEALLNLMNEMNAAGHLQIQPDMYSFSSLLNCYAKRGMADNAENLLQQIHDRHEAGALKYGPNTIMYNMVMNMYAKSRDENASQRAEQLLQDMIKLKDAGKRYVAPDVITYTSLLNCYANEGKAEDAEQLLQQMHALHEAGELESGPNIVSYSSVMDALCKSGETGVSRRAEAMMARMWDSYVDGLLDSPPDMTAYTILLKCYVNEGMAREAELLLKQMHSLHNEGNLKKGPNTIHYNIVLNCLAGSGDKDATRRAEALLQRMQDMYKGGHRELKPDVITYTSMLKCFGSEGMASEAEELLRQMQDMHRRGLLKDGPNIFSYNCVMHALAKSPEKDVTERAKALLKQMCNNPDMQPDEITKSSFVHCHAKAGDRAVGEHLFGTMTSC